MLNERQKRHYLILFCGILMLVLLSALGIAPITAQAATPEAYFTVVDVAGGVEIVEWSGDSKIEDIEIPATIGGKTVKSIGEKAFSNAPSIKTLTFETGSQLQTIGKEAFAVKYYLNLVSFPDSLVAVGENAFRGNFGNNFRQINIGSNDACALTNIGAYAFADLNVVTPSSFPGNYAFLGDYAFYNTSFYSDFNLTTKNLLQVGANAFEGTNLFSLNLGNQVAVVGANAFANCANLTIFSEHSSQPSGWASSWNSSNCPVVWNCTFDSTNSYVVSVTKTNNNINNVTDSRGVGAPRRNGYSFGGWYTTSDFSGTAYDDISAAPNGTLYAYWYQESSCIAEGTMITLADGSEVAVENLTGNEQLLVWNLNTGSFDSAPILFVDNEINAIREIIHLYFSDGTELKIVDEHALWCFDLNEYVYLDKTAENYVGKYFNKKTTTGYTAVELIDVEIYNEITRVYSPVTSEHLCYYVNGLLSIPGGISGLFNIFDVVATELKYDATSMQEDIQTYGLYTYEEFCLEVAEVPENIFEAFNGEYLKVSMGKGLINVEELLALIERYQVFFI